MSVGIFDADIHNYTLVPFNLQAMKLSSYYKRHREIVVLAKKFTPERNSKFFYLKDWDDGKYPSLNQPNVEYYGHAFSGSIYVPLDEDIELMKPDTELYSVYAKEIVGGEAYRKRIYDTLINAEHIRLSLDGKTVWSRYGRQFKSLLTAKTVLLHDYNLGEIEGAYDAVQDIIKQAERTKRPLQFGMKFPIKVKNSQDLLNWANLKSDGVFYSLRYDGVLNKEDFMKWIQIGIDQKNSALIEYNVTGNSFSQDDFLKNDILNVYKQLVISRSFRLKITLKYNKDFFVDKRWERVLDFMNCYQHSCQNFNPSNFIKTAETDTAFDFAKSIKESLYYDPNYPFTLQEVRQIFQFVHRENPELFDAFYNANFNTLKGEYYDTSRD